MSIAPIHDRQKRCFAYCGDDRCTCPANRAYGLLGRVSTALPVLSAMLRKIGADGGADLATEMHDEVAALRATDDAGGAAKAPDTGEGEASPKVQEGE